MVFILIPVMIAGMWAIMRHYRAVEDALTIDWPETELGDPREPHVIVPLSRIDKATHRALEYARGISHDVTALHVTNDPDSGAYLKRRWERSNIDVPLVVVESPYRALIPPVVAYINAIGQRYPNDPITVVLPEFVPRHFWEFFLHNQTALRLKLLLFFRPNTVVIDIPYMLEKAG
jgi:hypothetical protein